MENISALEYADRVEIFRHLAVDESGEINLELMDDIAFTHFHSFLEFCDRVFNEKDAILSISVSGKGESLQFNIEYK